MKDKIRILHMTPPNVNNGIYKYIFAHMKYMDQSKFQFEFLMQNKEELMCTEEYRKYHFPIRTFTTTQRENPEKFRQEIYEILSDGYDVLQLHTSYWRGFLIEEIAMEIGIPKVIVHAHSAGVDEEDSIERKRLFDIHEGFKAQFDPRYATHFCACSALAADWLFDVKIPRNKIQIFPNAIDTQRFVFSEDKRRIMREQWKLQNKIVVGNTGRYCYQKNQDFLVRAFAKAKKQNDKLFLLLIGEGNMQHQLDELIETLGIGDSVLRLDWQQNVEDYLQMMDVFAFPSRFEGLGISVIEAQAAGVKCLVADVVPGECKVTDLVTFLPLEEQVWADSLAKASNVYLRENTEDALTKQGYNIREEVKNLEKLYE